MLFHRGNADDEALTDLLIGEAVGHKLQHLAFPARQMIAARKGLHAAAGIGLLQRRAEVDEHVLDVFLQYIEDFDVARGEIAQLLAAEQVEHGADLALVLDDDATAEGDVGLAQELLVELRLAAHGFLHDIRVTVDGRIRHHLAEVMQIVLVVVDVQIRVDLVLGHAEEIAAVLIDALTAMQQEVPLRVGDEHARHTQQLLDEIREVLLRVEFQQYVIDGQPFRFFQHLPCLHKRKRRYAAVCCTTPLLPFIVQFYGLCLSFVNHSITAWNKSLSTIKI